MVKSRHFENMEVYKRSYDLSLELYRISDTFPADATNMKSQLRRALFSTFLNIAEGSGKASSREFFYFINVAYSSCREIKSLLSFTCDLGYILPHIAEDKINKLDILSAKLFTLMKVLERKIDMNKTKIRRYAYARNIIQEARSDNVT